MGSSQGYITTCKTFENGVLIEYIGNKFQFLRKWNIIDEH